MSKCEDCLFFGGNCGYHFRDGFDHIHYDIPNEDMYDGVIGDTPRCFQPSEDYLEEKKQEKIAYIASNYTLEEIERAIAIVREKEDMSEQEKWQKGIDDGNK